MRYHYLIRRVGIGEEHEVTSMIICDCCYKVLDTEDKAHRKSWYGKFRDNRQDFCKSCADELLPQGAYRHV